MWFLRKRYGLTQVSSSFYMAGKSILSPDLVAGHYSYIGPNCIIGPKVQIGRYSMLANNVSIVGGDHVFTDPTKPIIFSGRPHMPETFIGEDAWIGAQSIVMAGVSIGNGSIVGAGSVVTKDIPPYSIFAGTPARYIRDRFNPDEIEAHKQMLNRDDIEIDLCKINP